MRSLSARLTVFIALAMAVVLFALGAAVFVMLGHEVDQEAMRTAQTTAEQTLASLASGDIDNLAGNASAYLFGARPDAVVVQIVGPLRDILRSSQTPYLPLPSDLAQPVQEMVTYKGEPAAYVSVPIEQNGLLFGALQVGVSLGGSYAALRLLRALLVEGGLAGLVLVAVVGYLFSRRALRPVERLTQLATAISDADLAQRLQGASPRDELGRLALAFNHMLDRLEAAFQRQSRFVADASHELRTPLAVISGYAELLQKWAGQEPAVREEAVGAIGREAQRMQRLVHDLLLLARGAQGLQLQARRLDLGELAAETVAEAQALPGAPSVSDETREVVPALGDWDLLSSCSGSSWTTPSSTAGGGPCTSGRARRPRVPCSRCGTRGRAWRTRCASTRSSASTARTRPEPRAAAWASGSPSRARSPRPTARGSRSRPARARARPCAAPCRRRRGPTLSRPARRAASRGSARPYRAGRRRSGRPSAPAGPPGRPRRSPRRPRRCRRRCPPRA